MCHNDDREHEQQWDQFRAKENPALLDDTPLLHDFLIACHQARTRPLPGISPLQIRDRAKLEELAGGTYGPAELEYCRLIAPFGRPPAAGP